MLTHGRPVIPNLRVGLPYLAQNVILDEIQRRGQPALLSAGAFFRPSENGFRSVPREAWDLDVALDSGGFVAMALHGGFRWDISEYVEWVLTSAPDVLGLPWAWWAQMDYCCEAEIAPDRAEVRRRMERTIQSYADTCEEVDWWRGEGLHPIEAPYPMPVLQGRRPADYLWSVGALAAVCPGGTLPDLVGVGSVCRRELYGPEGLLPVLDALHEALPPHVRLHLFGVKGATLSKLQPYGDRVESVDSMAWDYAARMTAREQGISCSLSHRATVMAAWIDRMKKPLS